MAARINVKKQTVPASSAAARKSRTASIAFQPACCATAAMTPESDWATAAPRKKLMIEQRQQIAEILGQQGHFALSQVVGGQLQQVPAGEVDIHRI